jgi:hypothetical protein
LNSFISVSSDLQETVVRARPQLEKISGQEVSIRPRPGKWSKKEILGHLLDSASNNHQRFVRASLQKELTFPGYSQNELVELQRFNEMPWDFLIAFWSEYNLFLAKVVHELPEDALHVSCAIGNNRPTTLEWIAQDYVAHLKHHLNQILGQVFETTYGKRD